MTNGGWFYKAAVGAMMFLVCKGLVFCQGVDYYDNEKDWGERKMHKAEREMYNAEREMRNAQDSFTQDPGSANAQMEFAHAQMELDSAQREFKRAKRDFEDAEIQSQNAKAQRELWGDDEERDNRSTFIVDEDDVVGGDNGVFVRDGRLVQVQPPRPDWTVNTDIYPGGTVKSSCTIVPILKVKKQPRPCIAGQISVTLSGGLSGEPIVCLYVLTKKNEQTRRLGEYQAGRNGYELRSAIMRPALGTPMRQNVYDGWKEVHVGSRVKYGYGYRGEGSSIEEKSMLHQIPTLMRFTMNETRPDTPFVNLPRDVSAALYHIEVWHSGKCIGVKDGQIGSGIITAPIKDWFVTGRDSQGIIYECY